MAHNAQEQAAKEKMQENVALLEKALAELGAHKKQLDAQNAELAQQCAASEERYHTALQDIEQLQSEKGALEVQLKEKHEANQKLEEEAIEIRERLKVSHCSCY